MNREHGEIVGLKNILDLVPRRDLTWWVTEFWATGVRDSSLNIPELEARAIRGPGIRFSDSELRDLSRNLHQVVDGEFTAWASRRAADPEDWLVKLIAFDSSSWTIEFCPSDLEIEPDKLAGLDATPHAGDDD